MVDKVKKLEVIRHKVENLTKSPLYEYRTSNKYHPVIGEGDHDASLLFVGEAPGRNEAKEGRPFCGSAGKILDDLLVSIGAPRESVYITNIIKDRPQKNRDPLPAEIELYGPFLDQQIEIIQPNVIVTLGRYSMNYIMKKFGLDSEIEPISVAHGKVYRAEASYGSIHIAPQYHPAATIYNRKLIEILKKDFQVLRQFVA